MNIVLIGYRGSGKTTIGKRLASKLWKEFFDTDALVVERAGKSIREIFESGGEGAFRELERAVVEEVSGKKEAVIAVGGGAVLLAENVAALQRSGKLIWLKADAQTLYERIAADTGTAAARPNLRGGGAEEVRAVLAERATIYQGAAHASLDVSRLSVDDAIYHLTRLI